MEISEVVNTQLAFPGLVVGLVLICAVLVFVFGFKSVEDFPFDKLATVADDRKPAGKKRKVKDKKSQSNGQATTVSETKQKNSENSSSKVITNKVKQADKSPAKDVSKGSSKQEKKLIKTETSPAKAALKDTKNIKDANKITEDGPKGKLKDPGVKQQKDQQSNKQLKSKGKENVEVKNKKNIEKSKNKVEEKPKDFDEGEWEQAFSRKDKKNRKSVTPDEENMAEKSAKTEVVASPNKKKKAKAVVESPVSISADSESSPIPSAISTSDDVLEPVKEIKEKSVKKDKEQKKDKPKQVQEIIVAESTSTNVNADVENKAAKKKKKKPTANKENSESTAPLLEEKPVIEDTVPSKPKASESKQEEELHSTNGGAVFDELGDTWKEAKTQKKANKKKVRKAE